MVCSGTVLTCDDDEWECLCEESIYGQEWEREAVGVPTSEMSVKRELVDEELSLLRSDNKESWRHYPTDGGFCEERGKSDIKIDNHKELNLSILCYFW